MDEKGNNNKKGTSVGMALKLIEATHLATFHLLYKIMDSQSKYYGTPNNETELLIYCTASETII